MDEALINIIEQMEESGATPQQISDAIAEYESTGVANTEVLGKLEPLQDTTVEKTVEEKNVLVPEEPLESISSESSSESPLELRNEIKDDPRWQKLTYEDIEHIEQMEAEGKSTHEIQMFISNQMNDRYKYAENIEKSEKVTSHGEGGNDLPWLKEYGDLEADALELYIQGNTQAQVHELMEQKFYDNKQNKLHELVQAYVDEGNEIPTWYTDLLKTPVEERGSDFWDQLYKYTDDKDRGHVGSDALKLWRDAMSIDQETWDSGFEKIGLGGIREVDKTRGIPNEVAVLPKGYWEEGNKVYAEEGYPGLVRFAEGLAEKDEAYESTLEDVYNNKVLEAVGLDKLKLKNLTDAYFNIEQRARAAYPNARFYTSRLARVFFGDDSVDDYVDRNGEGSFWGSRISDKAAQKDYRTADILSKTTKDTEAILDNMLEGDMAGTMVAIMSAPAQAGASIINAIQTMGLALFSDMFAETYVGNNEWKAEDLGVTVDELIASGEDSIGIPLVFSTLAGALDLYSGGQGASTLYKTFIGKKSLKKMGLRLFKSNLIEGGTEMTQHALNESALALEKGEDAREATRAFFRALVSKEGIENGLQGFFATAVPGGISLAGKRQIGAMRDKKNIKAIEETLKEINTIEDKIKTGKPTKGETKLLREAKKRLKQQIRDLYVEPYANIKDAPAENATFIEKKIAQIEKIYKETNKAEFSENIDEKTFEILKEANDKKIAQLQKEVLVLAEPKKVIAYDNLTELEDATLRDTKKLDDDKISILKKKIRLLRKRNEKIKGKNKKILEKDNATGTEITQDKKLYDENNAKIDAAEAQITKIEEARSKQKVEKQKKIDKKLKEKGVKTEKSDAQIALEGIQGEQQDGKTKKTTPKKQAVKFVKKTAKVLKEAFTPYANEVSEDSNETIKEDKQSLADDKLELAQRIKDNKGTKRLEKRIADKEAALAEKGVTGLDSRQIADAVVDLRNKPTTKSVATKLANKLTKTAESIKDYIESNVSPEDARTALNNLKAAIKERKDLTTPQKDKLLNDLNTSEKAIAKKEESKTKKKSIKKKAQSKKRKVDEKEHYDNPETVEFDDILYEEDLTEALETVAEEMEKIDDEVELGEPVETDDSKGAGKAVAFVQNLIDDSITYINDKWKHATSGVKVHMKKLSVKSLHTIIAEGLVGNETESYKVASTPANKVLTRVGRRVYEKLVSLGEDVSEFHKLPPDVIIMLEEEGITDPDELLRRALHFNFIRAGGAAIELVGGPTGFLSYRRGYPSPKRHMDIRFLLIDYDALNNIGIISKLRQLKKDGAITLPKDWETRKGDMGLTIVDRLAFKEAIGYDVFQQLLNGGEMLAIEQDWNQAEVSTMKITDTEAYNTYIRGQAILEGKDYDKDALYKRPLSKPSVWSRFKNKTGLAAVANASPTLKKLMEHAEEALQGLSNAVRQKFTIDKRTWQVTNVLQPYLYTYKEKNYTDNVAGLKTDEFFIIQDIAKDWIDKTFHAMHFFDWRGRLNNSIKYLNFQGNKVAKSLYRFGTFKAIGREGFANIIKQIGDYLGTEVYLLESGELSFDPESGGKKISTKMMTNKDRFRVGWKLMVQVANLTADPTSKKSLAILSKVSDSDRGDVIALSVELNKMRAWVADGNDILTFESNYILWNDATVSGAQNLAMLVKDKTTLALVNGLNTYQKKDLYRKVGDLVFNAIADHEWTADDQAHYVRLNNELEDLEAAIKEVAWNDKLRKAAIKEYTDKVNGKEYDDLAKKYWGNKDRQQFIRKLAKGPVMTGFYSAGPWVMAEDLVKDFKPEVLHKNGNKVAPFSDINQGMAVWLTKKMKDATGEIAPGPKLAQSTFNRVARIATKNGHLLQLKGGINKFPFIQEYLKFRPLRDAAGKIRQYSAKVKNPGMMALRFGENINVNVKLGTPKPDKKKISSATAPNITHFLDGQIVASQYTNEMFALRSVATIHDNFGTHAADANAQVKSVLEAMVKQYKGEPMHNLINQMLSFDKSLALKEIAHYEKKRKKKGIIDADITEILDNNYAISSAGGLTRFTGWKPKNKEEAQFEAQLAERELREKGKQAIVEDNADKVNDESQGCKI